MAHLWTKKFNLKQKAGKSVKQESQADCQKKTALYFKYIDGIKKKKIKMHQRKLSDYLIKMIQKKLLYT